MGPLILTLLKSSGGMLISIIGQILASLVTKNVVEFVIIEILRLGAKLTKTDFDNKIVELAISNLKRNKKK